MTLLKRNRSLSQLEFYHTATIIRFDLVHFVMNEKIVPKRWRPVFTFPIIEHINRLIDDITAANTIYPPQSLHEATMRRDYQTGAIIAVEQIFQLLQGMLDLLPINPDKLDDMTEMLDKESSLLRGWRKAGNKFIEQFPK